jgi:hypothetical protein
MNTDFRRQPPLNIHASQTLSYPITPINTQPTIKLINNPSDNVILNFIKHNKNLIFYPYFILLGLYLYSAIKIYLLNRNINNFITENFILLFVITLISYFYYFLNKMKCLKEPIIKEQTIVPKLQCCEQNYRETKMFYAFIDELDEKDKMTCSNTNNTCTINNNNNMFNISELYNYIKNSKLTDILYYLILFVFICCITNHNYKIYISNIALKTYKFYFNINLALICCLLILIFNLFF